MREAYRIAEADVGDLEEIRRLELECFGSHAYDRSFIRFLLLDPDSIALKAVDERGRIIGSAIGRIEKARGSIVGGSTPSRSSPGIGGGGSADPC